MFSIFHINRKSFVVEKLETYSLPLFVVHFRIRFEVYMVLTSLGEELQFIENLFRIFNGLRMCGKQMF